MQTSNYVSIDFFDDTIWGPILLVGALFATLLLANVLKTKIPFLRKILIPNSVLGGVIVLIISTVCFYTTGKYLFNLPMFAPDGEGMSTLEVLTYHCLGIGFAAMSLRPENKKVTRERAKDVLNSGIMDVGGFMIQATLGIAITYIASKLINGFAPASGILLSFGYGQGTGQALNNGRNFDAVLGGGTYANMGLSLAALGFLVASIGGVIVFNYLRSRGKIGQYADDTFSVSMDEVMGENEAPMNESVDKLSLQIGFVLITYALAYGIMKFLGGLVGNLKGTVYGFNFIFAVLSAVIVKAVLRFFKKMGWMKQDYLNVYLLNRISGFAFDLMIVSGICAIQIDLIFNYLWVILLLAIVGAIATHYYTKFCCQKIFPKYKIEQYFAYFGMLTGTASTGMMLLRAADPELKTPAADNVVYQNFPAIILGLPMLILASYVTTNAASGNVALIAMGLSIAYFAVLMVLLFRSYIFKKKSK